MKSIGVFIMEAAVCGLLLWAGLSNRKILFINGPRSAVITLGIIGMLVFCTISVGKFISAAPAHPLTIAGYLVGAFAMLTFLAQLFKWSIPVIGDAKTALFLIAGSILVKSIIARIGSSMLNIQ